MLQSYDVFISENDAFLSDYGNDSYLLCRIYDGYLFQVTGSLDRNEILDLAMSTKIIDYPKYFKKTVTFCLPEPLSL